jgi:hypothetical protein
VLNGSMYIENPIFIEFIATCTLNILATNALYRELTLKKLAAFQRSIAAVKQHEHSQQFRIINVDLHL